MGDGVHDSMINVLETFPSTTAYRHPTAEVNLFDRTFMSDIISKVI